VADESKVKAVIKMSVLVHVCKQSYVMADQLMLVMKQMHEYAMGKQKDKNLVQTLNY